MRLLTNFDDADRAETLGQALYAAGIDNSVRPARDGSAGVWVHDEVKLAAARELLEAYETQPDDPRFQGAAGRARERQDDQEQAADQARSRTIPVRERFRLSGIGPVTLALLLACVAVAVLTTTSEGLSKLDIGDRTETVSWLSIQSYSRAGGYFSWYPGLSDLRAGQLWRLFTPMLLHFGVLHIVFNLWWLRDLGTMIERRQSSLLFAAMVLVLSGASNALQYAIGGGPTFGGMSGVVYGLFGYLWIRGRFDPASGYAIRREAIYWMVGFYVLCWTGAIGPIANWAHTGGLVVGALWGAASSGPLRRRLLGGRGGS